MGYYMKRSLFLVVICLFLTVSVAAQDVLVDHTCRDISGIPSDAMDAAESLTLHFRHASIGDSIWNYIDGTHGNVVPGRDPAGDGAWTHVMRDNPPFADKLTDFEAALAADSTNYTVFMMKLCYVDYAADWTAYRDKMLELETNYPDNILVWWTMPVTTTDAADGYGAFNDQRMAFNENIRTYCAANNKPLFDIADLESHDLDDVYYTDGSGDEVLSPDFASVVDGSHLSHDGRKEGAKMIWYLMARLAGWDPDPPPPVVPTRTDVDLSIKAHSEGTEVTSETQSVIQHYMDQN